MSCPNDSLGTASEEVPILQAEPGVSSQRVSRRVFARGVAVAALAAAAVLALSALAGIPGHTGLEASRAAGELRGTVELASEPYDCNVGFGNWKAGWSEGKKQWCCANKQVACPNAAMVVGAQSLPASAPGAPPLQRSCTCSTGDNGVYGICKEGALGCCNSRGVNCAPTELSTTVPAPAPPQVAALASPAPPPVTPCTCDDGSPGVESACKDGPGCCSSGGNSNYGNGYQCQHSDPTGSLVTTCVCDDGSQGVESACRDSPGCCSAGGNSNYGNGYKCQQDAVAQSEPGSATGLEAAVEAFKEAAKNAPPGVMEAIQEAMRKCKEEMGISGREDLANMEEPPGCLRRAARAAYEANYPDGPPAVKSTSTNYSIAVLEDTGYHTYYVNPGTGSWVSNTDGYGFILNTGFKAYLRKEDTWSSGDKSTFRTIDLTKEVFEVTITPDGNTCGCNYNTFLVDMPAAGGAGQEQDWYCDGNGAMNKFWCPEFDMLEANSGGAHVTNHNCGGSGPWQEGGCNGGGDPTIHFGGGMPTSHNNNDFGTTGSTIHSDSQYRFSIYCQENGEYGQAGSFLTCTSTMEQDGKKVTKTMGGPDPWGPEKELNEIWPFLKSGQVVVFNYWGAQPGQGFDLDWLGISDTCPSNDNCQFPNIKVSDIKIRTRQ